MSMNPNPDPESNGVAVHRASLLRELLVPLPSEVLHVNKKLTSLSETHDGASATFADGAVEQFDAVIGADGIFGFVRNYVLQDKDNKYGPSPAEFWDNRALVPIEKARVIIGNKHFSVDEVDCQHGWIGDGAFLLYDIFENQTMSQVVISAIENDLPRDHGERKRPLTREFLEGALKNWLDGLRCQRVIDSSRVTGIICGGREEGAGLDPKRLLEALKDRWGFIMGLDLDENREEALGKMDEFLFVNGEV